MADPKNSYPWPCQRDGANTREIAENPSPFCPENRSHKEWHDSYTGRETEEA